MTIRGAAGAWFQHLTAAVWSAPIDSEDMHTSALRAARLTEHAKELSALVCARLGLVEAAHREEGERWRETDRVTVRGRSEPTRVATPVG